MGTGRKIILSVLMAGMVLGTGACSSQRERPVYDIVWPLPPEQPRIKFVDMIRTNKDVVKEDAAITSFLLGPEGIISLSKPHGVAAGKGRIYVTDLGKVFVFDTVNHKMYFIGSGGGTGSVKMPTGIAVSADDRVFVSDSGHHKVFVYDVRGRLMGVMGQSGDLHNPGGIALDEQRKIMYVANVKKHSIAAYSMDNYQFIMSFGERGTDEGMFNFPTNVAVDPGGNIYVVDTGNFRVQKFDPEGTFLTSFGSLGDAYGNFVRPKGIALDSEGHIYVVDAAFQNVQIFNEEGRLLLWFGGGGRVPGQFNIPAGIAIDAGDRIYVVDQLNRRVQIFQYLSAAEEGGTQGESEVREEAEGEAEGKR